ncbi:MAG: ATP-binding protein [Verrucomicrobiaceae bacterium]|nr:MAG: ATP-binding protein [Verrucomicrobiaceae bacterium]
MVERTETKERISAALERSRVVALIGPRQCGKTTLAEGFLPPDSEGYFDLEDPENLIHLDEPKTTLARLSGLVVIDEVQRRPELFPLLRVLADRKPLPAKFLILGSASPELLRQSSESLAGRMETIELTGFTLAETGRENLTRHWLRGGFPLSYLAKNDSNSFAWRKSFISSFLERDLPSFGIGISAVTLHRFWAMLAHYHGQIWNASEIAGSMGVSSATIKNYLDILTHTFMIRQLQPWHENLGKRQVKAPKIYFRDSGIFHSLAGIRREEELFRHPKLGASWEGYAIEEIIRFFEPDQAYFWATHNGAELDLFLLKDGKRIGVECKRQDAPRITPSMRIAMEDLRLDELHVFYPGQKSYPLAENITVTPLISLAVNRQ